MQPNFIDPDEQDLAGELDFADEDYIAIEKSECQCCACQTEV